MSTQKDYETFLAQVAKQTGLSALTPDKDGLISLRIEDTYTLNLQFVAASSKILSFVEVAKIPENADAEVYRELLAAGLFGQETGGGYFALERVSNVVVYNYTFDFNPNTADVDLFTDTLEKILSLVDMWAKRINVICNPNADSESASIDFSMFRV